MGKWDRSVRSVLWSLIAVLAFSVAWTGCARPSPRNVADQRVVTMEVTPQRQLPAGHPATQRIDYSEIERGAQADGEAYGGVRPPIPDRVKDFLQDRVFAYGTRTVRIEMPPQHDRSIVSPIVWINPVNIPREHLYGSDVTLITDPHPTSYSPRDIEAVNTRQTVTVVPLGLHRDQLTGGQRVDLLPGDVIAKRNIPILANHAYVRGFPAFDIDRSHLGYLMLPKVFDPDTQRYEQVNIYYTGPVSGEAARAVPQRVDALIIPLTEPNRINATQVLEFARRVEAGVIVPLSGGLPEGAAIIAELEQTSEIPLWIPPTPPERPEPRPAG